MWAQSTTLVLLIEWLFVLAVSCLAMVQHSTACQKQVCASQLCWVSGKMHLHVAEYSSERAKHASYRRRSSTWKRQYYSFPYKQQTCTRNRNLAVNDNIVNVMQGKCRWADCAPTRHGAQFATANARRGETGCKSRCRQQRADGCTHGQRGPLQYCRVDMPLCGCWEIQAGVIRPGIQPNDALYRLCVKLFCHWCGITCRARMSV